MYQKPVNFTVTPITLVDITALFGENIVGPELTDKILKSNDLNHTFEAEFSDNQLKESTTTSSAKDDEEKMYKRKGLSYSGLSEIVAYLKTRYGKRKTIYHQVVSCNPFMVNGKAYTIAVGRNSGHLTLFLLENGDKVKWPTTAIFLKHRKKDWKKPEESE